MRTSLSAERSTRLPAWPEAPKPRADHPACDCLYFVGKIKHGESEPFYEKLALDVMGLKKIKA